MKRLLSKSREVFLRVGGEDKKGKIRFSGHLEYWEHYDKNIPGYLLSFAVMMEPKDGENYEYYDNVFVESPLTTISFEPLLAEIIKQWKGYILNSRVPDFYKIQERLTQKLRKNQICFAKRKEEFIDMRIDFAGKYDMFYYSGDRFMCGDISQNNIFLNFTMTEYLTCW